MSLEGTVTFPRGLQKYRVTIDEDGAHVEMKKRMHRFRTGYEDRGPWRTLTEEPVEKQVAMAIHRAVDELLWRQKHDGEVTIRAEDFTELQGQVRYQLGRNLFLSPTRVMVGNTTPRDISDETGENTLLFENTRLLEANVRNDEGELVLTLPSRDDLHDLFKENYEGGHDIEETE